jgi:hypothetical protein
MVRSRFGQTLRNSVLELISRFPSLMKRLSETNLQIAHHYRGSPAVAEERTGLLQANLLADRSSEHPRVGDWREFDAPPQPGDRVPDVRTSAGTLFEKLRGTHHTLLLFDGRAPTPEGYVNLARIAEDARTRWGDLVRPVVVVHGKDRPRELASGADESVWLDADGALHSRVGAGAECLYLVRPDGYVGFRAQPASSEPLVAYMSRVRL